jgi:uncharacterized protein (DUF849 family)
MKAAMPTIIACAVTGSITTRANHPELPRTPRELAKACVDSVKAGAAMVHIHVRRPDRRPSVELAHDRETVDRIRDSGTDVLINLTAGRGQRIIPSPGDPKLAALGAKAATIVDALGGEVATVAQAREDLGLRQG